MEILQEQAHKLLYLVLLLCGVVTTQRAGILWHRSNRMLIVHFPC